jgi:hypothetical protein
MKNIVIGYLTYVNDGNAQYRYDDFVNSLASLEQWKGNSIISIDNASNDSVKSALKESQLFECYISYSKNYYDVALFYSLYWYALRTNSKYALMTYDDFTLHDANAINDCVAFMNAHEEIACMRVTDYSYDNMRLYDAQITPKSKNPDAIRHFNNVDNKKLTWEGPERFGDSKFYINNWHYTSRPTLWRTDELRKILPTTSTVPVLQQFEAYAMNAFYNLGSKVGVLDNGMLRSSPTVRSARTNELSSKVEQTILVDLNNMQKEYRVYA